MIIGCFFLDSKWDADLYKAHGPLKIAEVIYKGLKIGLTLKA